MLNLLLEKLKEGDTYSLADLARDFNVSQSQMEQMIQHLVRLGYLKTVTGCETSQCHSCSISAACKQNPSTQLWTFAASHNPEHKK